MNKHADRQKDIRERIRTCTHNTLLILFPHRLLGTFKVHEEWKINIHRLESSKITKGSILLRTVSSEFVSPSVGRYRYLILRFHLFKNKYIEMIVDV